MSAHVEFDFNDDGTVTMTSRPSKQEAVCTARLESYANGWHVRVAAGKDDTVTHRILIYENGEMFVNVKEWAA